MHNEVLTVGSKNPLYYQSAFSSVKPTKLNHSETDLKIGLNQSCFYLFQDDDGFSEIEDSSSSSSSSSSDENDSSSDADEDTIKNVDLENGRLLVEKNNCRKQVNQIVSKDLIKGKGL